MASHLLLAMSVPSLFVGHAMNTRGRTGINLAHSARPDTRDIKVWMILIEQLS